MWGLKIYQNRQAITKAASTIFNNTEHSIIKGFDQRMMNNYLRPLTVNDSVIFLSFINNFLLSSDAEICWDQSKNYN